MTEALPPLALDILQEVQQRGTISLELLRERLGISSAARFQKALAILELHRLVQRDGNRGDPGIRFTPKPDVPPGHKFCQRRRHILPISEFTSGSDGDGLHRWCAACCREQRAQVKNKQSASPTEAGATQPQQESS